MAHLVLQDVDPRVIESLGARAARQGRSIEEEARALLEGALGLSRQRAREGARQVRVQWAGRVMTPSDRLLAHDRDPGDRLGGSGAAPGGGGAEEEA
jgi:plasmid stability protein